MRLVVPELTGGLGNQMFQYAAGLAAARRARASLALDLRHYDVVDPNLPPRPFALRRFSLSASRMTPKQERRADFSLAAAGIAPSQLNRRDIKQATRATSRWARWLGRKTGYVMPVIIDRANGDDARLHHIADSAYLIGCWQTEKLFADHADEVRKEFTFRNDLGQQNANLISRIRAQESVSVHFRRTDYLLATTLTRVLDLQYYLGALKKIRAEVPNAHYFIFSDDPAWVTSTVDLPTNHTMVTHNAGVDDGEDMRLMSECKHFIIANSTFSWWGAWLSRNPDKVVIAPSGWFRTAHGSEVDLVPKSWMLM